MLFGTRRVIVCSSARMSAMAANQRWYVSALTCGLMAAAMLSQI